MRSLTDQKKGSQDDTYFEQVMNLLEVGVKQDTSQRL
jgi:hypothetical protein